MAGVTPSHGGASGSLAALKYAKKPSARPMLYAPKAPVARGKSAVTAAPPTAPITVARSERLVWFVVRRKVLYVIQPTTTPKQNAPARDNTVTQMATSTTTKLLAKKVEMWITVHLRIVLKHRPV
jgi:hypothetical protein